MVSPNDPFWTFDFDNAYFDSDDDDMESSGCGDDMDVSDCDHDMMSVIVMMTWKLV